MEFQAKDIATFLSGEIDGDENITVFKVSKIEEGEPGALAFLANPKYENYIYTTKASVVLVSKNFKLKSAVQATLIKVDDPYQAFASLLELYIQAKSMSKSGIEQPSFIHKNAIIEDDLYLGAFAYVSKNARIGKNVKIYPQTFVGENVTIGDNCILYSGVKIYDDCIIGNECIIHSGVVVGSDGFGFAPQDDGTYKKIPQIGNVIIEDNVEIGANTTIDCSTMGSTIIRKGVKIDNLIQIAHNCEVGENTVMAAQTGIAGSTKIGKNCKIAGQSGFAGHLVIGNDVTVAAQAGVLKSIKDGVTVWGTPAIPIKDQIRALTVFKDLPKIQKDIIDLQRIIEKSKKTKN